MIKKILGYRPDKKKLWSGEYKIPWNESGFSKRMLKMHLSQKHDMASRKKEGIKKHVDWIHNEILKKKPSNILDLGCGPGLYIKNLMELGHICKGIDFSPASVEYARELCKGSDIILGDICTADYGKDLDLVMLLFGDQNVFPKNECKKIIEKSSKSLKPGGILLLEVHLFDTVKNAGQSPASWYRSGSSSTMDWMDDVMNEGLFSEKPHLCLIENHWFEGEKTALTDFWIIEEGVEDLSHYVNTVQAYTDSEYRDLLKEFQFNEITFHGDYGSALTSKSPFQVISAVKK